MVNFAIPHRLTRLNEYINQERRNKYAAASIKSKMTTLCSYYVPNDKINYEIEIEMIWTVKSLANDLDNVSFGKKFILDAMAQKGLIKNDNLTVVKKITDTFIKGSNEGVEVIIKKYKEEK